MFRVWRRIKLEIFQQNYAFKANNIVFCFHKIHEIKLNWLKRFVKIVSVAPTCSDMARHVNVCTIMTSSIDRLQFAVCSLLEIAISHLHCDVLRSTCLMWQNNHSCLHSINILTATNALLHFRISFKYNYEIYFAMRKWIDTKRKWKMYIVMHSSWFGNFVFASHYKLCFSGNLTLVCLSGFLSNSAKWDTVRELRVRESSYCVAIMTDIDPMYIHDCSWTGLFEWYVTRIPVMQTKQCSASAHAVFNLAIWWINWDKIIRWLVGTICITTLRSFAEAA